MISFLPYQYLFIIVWVTNSYSFWENGEPLLTKKLSGTCGPIYIIKLLRECVPLGWSRPGSLIHHQPWFIKGAIEGLLSVDSLVSLMHHHLRVLELFDPDLHMIWRNLICTQLCMHVRKKYFQCRWLTSYVWTTVLANYWKKMRT